MLSVYICLLNIAGLLVLANFIYFLFCTNTVDIKRFKEIKVICIDYLLCAIAYVFAIKSQTEMLANIWYCAYYILVDWMLFFLILFTRQYTKSIENTSLMVGLSLVVAILDSASIVTNLKFNHVFWLEHTEIENNVMAFLPKHNDYMYVHATFTVILFIVVFVIFVKRLLQVDHFKAFLDRDTFGTQNNECQMILLAFDTFMKMKIDPEKYVRLMSEESGSDYDGKF